MDAVARGESGIVGRVSAPPEPRRMPPAPAPPAASTNPSSGMRALLEAAIAAEAAEEAAEAAHDVDSETEPEHTQRMSGEVFAAIVASAESAAAGSSTFAEEFEDETTTFAGAIRKPPRAPSAAAASPRAVARAHAGPARAEPAPAGGARAEAARAAPVSAGGASAGTASADPASAGTASAGPASASPVAAASAAGVAHIGRYEVVRRLAYGGMAEVFLAREPLAVGASRLVVLKRVLPHVADDAAFVAMFLDEARVALQLQHPQICASFDAGHGEDGPFLAMEYVDGRSLAQIIALARAGGALPPAVIARIVSLIAEALHHAHGAHDADGAPLHVVHRDVSPSNIMVGRDGRVKLLDFGVAKARSHATRTCPGIVKGKFAYMAPEQCRGAVADPRADVFALGICLYEALTRTPLYARESEYATMTAVLHEPPASPRAADPRIPEALDAIVLRALAKEPEARFPTALAMQEALEAWLASSGAAVYSARIAAAVDGLVTRTPDAVDALLDALPGPAGAEDVDVDLDPVGDTGRVVAGAGADRFVAPVVAVADEPIPETRPGDGRRRAPLAAPPASSEATLQIAAARVTSAQETGRHRGVAGLLLGAALVGLALWLALR